MEQLSTSRQIHDRTISMFPHDENPGQTYYELKETALVAYEQAIQLAPYAAVLYYHKGQVLERLGQEVEAQLAYAQARRLGYQV
ncbi:MAG TPA: hypothetical protein VKX46_02635 [Ktedonobacteraceae bacterium]|nr:hypothetical protein [Ktedonobacteraceae bacterium]